jgi:hypothetical protein
MMKGRADASAMEAGRLAQEERVENDLHSAKGYLKEEQRGTLE